MKKLEIQKMSLRYLIASWMFFLPLLLLAQQPPAPSQSEQIAIYGATAHIGNGKVIEDSFILIKNGKITWIGKASEAPSQPDVGRTILADGKDVYPGFIALDSSLGLTEIGAVRATRDVDEIGDFNPSIRSLIAFNTDSKVIPTVRSNGVLFAQIVPQGGTMPGKSSVVQLDAWNWEDAVVRADEGIHLHWPRSYRRTGWWAEPGGIKPNEEYQKQVDEIKMFFAEAKAYQNSNAKTKNIKFEAMAKLFSNEINLYIHASHAKGMMTAVLFAKELGIKPILLGAEDAWLITDFLRENEVSVILGAAHDLPNRKEDDIDITYKMPSILHDAGIAFAISRDGYYDQRNLPFQAGHAVGFGLPYEAAIEAITLSPAKILGIDNIYGSLEVGKSASLFISKGDVLDMRSSKITHALIDGRIIDLDNKQKALYRKFTQKYENDQNR